MSQKNILKQKIVINIEDVVATTTLDQNINIKKIVKAFHAKYNPDIFPVAIIWLDDPRAEVKMKIPTDCAKYFSSLSRICVNAEFGAAITRKITIRSKYKISTTLWQ